MKQTPKCCSVFNSDASETVAYNNPLFPAYAARSLLSSYPDYSSVSHWHKDLEFILVKKGAMTYNVNGQLLELTEGGGILVNSRQLHYGFSAQRRECAFICILLSPELLQGNGWFYQNYVECVTENGAFPYLLLRPDDWTSSILGRLESLQRSLCADPPQPLSCFHAMEDFLFIMKTLYENLDVENRRRAAASPDLLALRNMMSYIEEHYAEPVALEDIALSGTCCKSKCSALFKKYLRDTPGVYLTKLRLRKSLDPLLNSDKNVTAVAHACGFNGASYYCETFKKYYGVSPMMYKKNNA